MRGLLCSVVVLVAAGVAGAQGARVFEPSDVFSLEYASDPRVSPDGERVAYVRVSGDIMTDRFERSVWVVGVDGSGHRPVVQGDWSYGSPRWSPSGDRLLFTASRDGAHELRVLYWDTREVGTIAEVREAPGSVVWSPDGRSVAFTMFVETDGPKPAAMPEKPEGAEWAEPAEVIERPVYRADGRGMLPHGATQVFVVPADGGTPRQVTSGDYDHEGPLAWTPDGRRIVYAANPAEDREFDPIESDLFALDLASGATGRLTERDGPDTDPAVSPDGRRLAYLGFEDGAQGYQVTRLSVLDLRTGEARVLTEDLDRSVRAPVWSADGSAVFALYDDRGVTRVARVGMDGSVADAARGVGGATLGRPYPSGGFSVGPGVGPDGLIATVMGSATRPADVAVVRGGSAERLTDLNADVLGHKDLAGVESFTVESSADGLEVQAWVMYPPDASREEPLPMILEIHGGPFANYGPRFSAEAQLYAAAGYAVVYANPRGSTSYGRSFGNAIHHAYPGRDYDDLMSVVDGAAARGIADPDRLFVTGGSGGGVLTAWIVGKTDRFRAAVVAKPVINWISFALYADNPTYFWKYWFPAEPWEAFDHYWERSPLSLVGNVTTPTMLLTGEADLRTPMAETEQYYQALRLREVPTRMVRIPGASHGIASRPSRLVAKVANVLAWFGAHGGLARAADD